MNRILGAKVGGRYRDGGNGGHAACRPSVADALGTLCPGELRGGRGRLLPCPGAARFNALTSLIHQRSQYSKQPPHLSLSSRFS